MKETPMLFCGPMARAAIENRKTVTRRLVKPQPGTEWPDRIECSVYHPSLTDPRDGEIFPGPETFGFFDDERDWPFPYGRPGDRIWGKETFRDSGAPDGDPEFEYRANYSESAATVFSWRPSIFMPRWASRIHLEILPDVFVERVQNISAEDCIAEGLSTTLRGQSAVEDLRNQYRMLWNRLNLHPKPIKYGGKIVRYEAFPWGLADFAEAYAEVLPREYRKAGSVYAEFKGLPIDIYPDPFVWRIPFRRIAI